MEWGDIGWVDIEGVGLLVRWLAVPVAVLLVIHGLRDLFAELATALLRGLRRSWRSRRAPTGASLSPPSRLGELLRRREGLRAKDLERGLRLHRESGHPLGAVLERIGSATAAQVDGALAQQHALPLVAVDPHAIPGALLAALPEEEAEAWGALPLRVDGERVLVACSRRPSPGIERKMATRLGAPVELAFCGDDRLRRARRIAYRRPRAREAQTTAHDRLGERLVFAGMLPEEVLDGVLEEQRQTGEHLADLLVRRGLVTSEAITDVALGPLARGFVEVAPEDVDLFGLRRLGYAACSFHDALPLWGHGATRTVASAHPLHPATVRAFERRLGIRVRPVLAPALQVRAARLAAARRAWPRGIHGGAIHTDAAELEALVRALRQRHVKLPRLSRETLRTGRAPIELALEHGVLTEGESVELLAATYLMEAGAMPREPRRGWLPPELELRGDPLVTAAGGAELEVVTRRPCPDHARELRALHPSRAIRWRVAAGPRTAPRRLTA